MDPEIEELKAQVASLQEQLAALAFAREDTAPGGGEIPTQFFPIGSVPAVSDVDGPFSPLYDTSGSDPEVVTGLTNCYWQSGGVTQHMADQQRPGTDGFIALKAGATPTTSGTAALCCYANLAALQAAQRDVAYFIVPLYVVASSKIVLDLRNIPHVYTAEVL